MISLSRLVLAASACIPLCLAASEAARADNATVIETLKKTPVSVFTYGLNDLRQSLFAAFASDRPEPFAMATAPLTGKIADLSTVIYSDKTNSIILNLVKIEKLDDGASPDDACHQAMAALRTFASVDPTTGTLQPGFDTTILSVAFYPDGTPIPAAASNPADIHKLFRLRYNGSTGKARFTCTADLFATDYKLEIK